MKSLPFLTHRRNFYINHQPNGNTHVVRYFRHRSHRLCQSYALLLVAVAFIFLLLLFSMNKLSYSITSAGIGYTKSRDVTTGRGTAIEGGRRHITMGVLFHGEYSSLNRSVMTWKQGGLLQYVGEVIYFLNGVDGKEDFEKVMGRIVRDVDDGYADNGMKEKMKVRVVNSKENLRLGLAIGKMVRLAMYEDFLLLEKDWALVENERVMVGMLDGAMKMIAPGGGVDIVRLRSRRRPGAPLHARIMHEGREDSMLREQKNLFCFAHHWLKDPVKIYPSYFQACPRQLGLQGPLEVPEMDKVVCSKAKFCQWTNNPCIFKKQWFLRELYAPFLQKYTSIVKRDPHRNMLDFEYFTNWNMTVWNDRDFVVALPKGLFEHHEVNEQNTMNTIWYAWRRLDTDVQELRNDYLMAEPRLRKSQRAKHDPGKTIASAFPLEFVRLYHYRDAMARSPHEAVKDIERLAEESRTRLEEGVGTWRHAVTAVTDELHKCMLYSPVVEPRDMRITFVTSLFDARGEPRAFQSEIEKLARNLMMLRNYPRIVYAGRETIAKIEKMLPRQAVDHTAVYFIPTSKDALVKHFVKSEQFDRMESIYAWGAWKAAIDYSRPYFLHDAAVKRKVFGRTHYVYIEPTTECLSTSFQSPTTLSPQNDHVLRAHLMNNFFVMTTSSRVPDLTHFSAKFIARNMEYSGVPPTVELVSEGLMGGTPLAIAAITSHYDAIARYTLKTGHMSNMQIVLSIALKNVRYHFSPFPIDDVCRYRSESSVGCQKNIQEDILGDKTCSLFKWAATPA